jgi:nitrogen fixation/metabolism regulation signal transduction histidine kinase
MVLRELSLRSKMFILLIMVVVFASVPLIMIFYNTTETISKLGRDPIIEQALEKSIDTFTGEDRERAAEALKTYRTITVLKPDLIVKQSLIASILISTLILIIFLIVGFIFVSQIMKPLRHLTGATQEIAKGNIEYQIKARAGAELGQLITSFNNMARDLKFARQQLAIAERRATWQRVARTIAHEIKNPLTPIKLSTERMYDKFLNESRDFPEVIKSATRTILSEIDQMQRLVETFHKYAKFPDPVLKTDSVNEIISEVRNLYRDQQVKIEADLQEDISPLQLDHGQIREAFTNLVKNSIEAISENDDEGVISIESQAVPQGVKVEIRDNGCGISPEDQKKLFQPYFTTKKQGSGIGLALTERIINLHGGKIFCESEKGKGTKFTVIFENKQEG